MARERKTHHYPRIVWTIHRFSANHALCISWAPYKITVTPVKRDVDCKRCQRSLRARRQAGRQK